MPDTLTFQFPYFSNAPAPPEMPGERSTVNSNNLFERKIIKTGEIRFETNDLKATESVIIKAATWHQDPCPADQSLKFQAKSSFG